MADDQSTIPQLPTAAQAAPPQGKYGPGFMGGLLGQIGPGMHAREQAQLSQQGATRDWLTKQLHEGVMNGTIKPPDPNVPGSKGDARYEWLNAEIGKTLGKGGKGLWQQAGQILQNLGHHGERLGGKAPSPPPPPPSAMDTAHRNELDEITAQGTPGAQQGGPPMATAGAGAATGIPSPPPSAADLTRGRGATPTFPNQAPPTASDSNMFAESARRSRDIATQHAKEQALATGEAATQTEMSRKGAEWEFTQAHNPLTLSIRQKEEALGRPLTETEKSIALGVIPKNTVKVWGRDPGGKLYSYAVSKQTNQPIPGTENYNDVSLPPSLSTRVKIGEHFYQDDEGNLRAVSTTTVSQPGAGGASGPPTAAGGGGGKPAAHAGGGAGRLIGPTKGTLMVMPTPNGPVTFTARPNMALPMGAVTAQQFGSANVPTGATRTRAEFATGLVPAVDRAIADVQHAAPKLGALKGRYNEFIAGKLGGGLDDDPEISALRTEIGLIQTGMMVPHVGARGGIKLIEKFKNMIDSGKLDAPQLTAALGEMRKFLVTYADEGKLKGWGNVPYDAPASVTMAVAPPPSASSSAGGGGSLDDEIMNAVKAAKGSKK